MRGGGLRTEPTLAERIRDGDRAAENELVERFYRRVLLVARVRVGDDQTARDIAQAVMLGVRRGVRAGRLDCNDHLAGYVLGTARDIINSSAGSKRSEGAAADQLDDRVADPLQMTGLHELVDSVRLSLDELGPVDRTILGLILVEGMKPGDIAARLGMKNELVRRRTARALKRVCEMVRTRSRTRPPRH